MTNKAVLNNVDHGDLKVLSRYGSEFGDSVNQVLVFPTEFEQIQREYPILFQRGNDGETQAVAILGLDRDENLFLADDGSWQARYVPAIQQRGPFSIVMARQPGGDDQTVEPMILVDLDDPRVGSETGVALFLPQGGNAPYLEHIIGVLQLIHLGLELSAPIYAVYEELGLLEPVLLEINLSEVEKYKLPSHYTIAADRLAALNGEQLERLSAANALVPAVLAMASLGNFSRLIDLKNRRNMPI